MSRLAVIIALLVCLSASAFGNAFVVTNRIEELVTATNPVNKQASVRMVINARLGDWNLPLVLSGHSIVWEWRDPRVGGLLVYSWPGQVLDAAAGRVVVTAGLDRVETGTYDAEAWAILNGIRAHRLAADIIMVTNSVSTTGTSATYVTNNITLGSVTVGVQIAEGAVTVDSSVTLTNIINVTNTFQLGNISVTNQFGDTFVTNQITVEGVVINNTNIFEFPTSTVYMTAILESTDASLDITGAGTVEDPFDLSVVGGGGGGDLNATNLIGAYPIIITNFAGNVYVGYASLAGGIIIIPDANSTVTVQQVSNTNNLYVVPLGVTQMVASMWGSAGGTASGAAGGYTEVIFQVTPLEVLTLAVGVGGGVVVLTNAVGASTLAGGWPDGGMAVARNNYANAPGAGGGSTAIYRGTNIIAVAGSGGGGATGGILGGAGGGNSGAAGALGGGFGGGSGTQDAGGSAYVTNIAMWVTNSAGGRFFGGSGGVTTNNATGHGGGGGGGWWGGGGGIAIQAAGSRGAGGGGSGYYNPSLVTFGYTIRGGATLPPNQESAVYGTDTKGVGWGVVAATIGGNGAIVLRYILP